MNNDSAIIQRCIADFSCFLGLVQIHPNIVRRDFWQLLIDLEKEIPEDHVVQLQRADAQSLDFSCRKINLIAFRKISLVWDDFRFSRLYFVVRHKNGQFLIHDFKCIIRDLVHKLRHEFFHKLFAHKKTSLWGTQKEADVL